MNDNPPFWLFQIPPPAVPTNKLSWPLALIPSIEVILQLMVDGPNGLAPIT